MRKSTVSLLSVLCLFAGLAVSASTAVAQSSDLNQGVTLSPENLSFSVSAGHSATAPVVLSNQSGAIVNVSKIDIAETCSNAAASNCGTQFHVLSNGCGGILRNGMSCAINVEFVPAADVETARATLKVSFTGAAIIEIRRSVLTGTSRP